MSATKRKKGFRLLVGSIIAVVILKDAPAALSLLEQWLRL